MRNAHCRGCGRLVGLTDVSRIPSIYCTDAYCRFIPDAGRNETRDDLITLLLARGADTADITAMFGLTQQRVSQLRGTS